MVDIGPRTEHAAGTGWGGDVSPGFLRAFRQGRLAPASDLNSAFLRPTYPEQIPHAYFQASLLMEMIVQSHGFEAILGMLRGYAEGLTTIDLLQRQLGRDAQAFDREFEAFVEQRYASSLAGLVGADGAAGKPGGGYGLLLDQARQAQRDGDSLRALLLAGRARDLFPDHGGPGSAYALLARIHRARGEIDAAVVALSASVGIDADHLEGFRQLAELQRMRGESAAAATALERALLIQPFDPAIHRDLAEIHEALGNWPLVADARAAIAALQPADPVGARYQLALALSRSGQTLAARRQVLLALEAAPLYEEALELLLTVRDQIEESATRPSSPDLPEASPARAGEPPIPYGL